MSLFDGFDVDVFASKTDKAPHDLARDRRPRAVPDGILGVVFRGRVYPVYAPADRSRRRIYLDDASLEKNVCPWCDDENTLSPIPIGGPGPASRSWRYPDDWYIETNSYGHYVVLDSDSKAFVQSLVGTLGNEGFDVIRWGASVRAADNGVHYKWFVRVSRNRGHDVLADVVQRFLEACNRRPPDHETRPAQLDMDAIRETVAHAMERLGIRFPGAVDKLEQARSLFLDACSDAGASSAAYRLLERSGILQQNLRLAGHWDADKPDALFDPELYEATIRALDEAWTEADELDAKLEHSLEMHFALENERTRLSTQLAQTQDELKRISADAKRDGSADEVEFWRMLEELQHSNNTLQAEIDRLRGQLREERAQTTIAPAIGRSPQRVADYLAKVLRACFPELAFDPDAPIVIARRFQNIEPLMSVLADLNAGAEMELARVQGGASSKDWREIARHIATGCDDRGRLYVRKASIDSCRWDVYVHWKQDEKEQRRVFERLATLGPFADAYRSDFETENRGGQLPANA